MDKNTDAEARADRHASRSFWLLMCLLRALPGSPCAHGACAATRGLLLCASERTRGGPGWRTQNGIGFRSTGRPVNPSRVNSSLGGSCETASRLERRWQVEAHDSSRGCRRAHVLATSASASSIGAQPRP